VGAASVALTLAVPLAHGQTCPFDNGGSSLENDGLVLTRYALGLRGAPMVANTAFAAGDATTIENNIACPSCGLNVTGGATFSVADATIVSRKIAGFSGPALTNGLGLSGPTIAAVNSFLLAGCGTTSNGWVQGGNAFGVPGVLSTSDGQSLTVGTGLGDGLRISRSNTQRPFEFAGIVKTVNVVNGSRDNFIDPSVSAGTISGGGYFQDLGLVSQRFDPNRVVSTGGTVGGGGGNTAGSPNVDGFATVGGGYRNHAWGAFGTVAGGNNNVAGGIYTTVAGGWGNETKGEGTTIPGGAFNVASGVYSFAAGYRAKNYASGAFMWADSTALDFKVQDSELTGPGASGWATGENTFNARATGGAWFVTAVSANGRPTAGPYVNAGSGTWAATSDRQSKTAINAVNTQDILRKVVAMPISSWQYLTETGVRHIGPMAQDFKRLFAVGRDDKSITTIDADGVALAAIQGLHQMVKAKDAKISALEKASATMLREMAAIKKKLGM
jgi:hypothetical protein